MGMCVMCYRHRMSYRAGGALRGHHQPLCFADEEFEPKEVKWHIQVQRVHEC